MSTVGSVGRAEGSKRASSSASAGTSPGSARPTGGPSCGADVGGPVAGGRAIGERHGAVALGQPRAVGAEHERHVRVARRGQAEPRGDVQLARRRLDEVGAAHDLAHALRCVVDDHGEIVCGGAVVAAHDEVVDDVLVPSEQAVGERDGDRRGRAGAARAGDRRARARPAERRVSARQVPG